MQTAELYQQEDDTDPVQESDVSDIDSDDQTNLFGTHLD